MTCIWKNTKVLFFELKKPAKSQAFLSAMSQLTVEINVKPSKVVKGGHYEISRIPQDA